MKYIPAKRKAAKPRISQVIEKPYELSNAPPRIGATMHPVAYEVLNIPEALSLRT